MDKIYCENKKIELENQKEELLEIVENIKKRYKGKEKRQYKKIYEAACNYDFNMLSLLMDLQRSFNRLHKDDSDKIEIDENELNAIYELKSIEHTLEMFDDLYLDTSWIRFDGDVIITDPCYLVSLLDGKRDEKLQFLDDNLDLLKSTLYGDWGCITIDTDTKEEIGTFCADGAMVCVISLEEVKKLTPDYVPHEEATLLKDFHGEIRIVIEEEFYEYEGKTHKDYSVHVEGKGNINFKTYQNSF